MEEQTTITSVFERQIYKVETIDNGSQEVLEKINKLENSISKAYEICKETTIYTANVVDDTKEQPYLEYIIPTLYQIGQKVRYIVENSPVKIDTVYLTGTLSIINNVDLYFQEFLAQAECKILKPSIIEGNITQINIKDYIEVNSAISLAMQALGEGVQSLNFKNLSEIEKLKQKIISVLPAPKPKKENKKNDKAKKELPKLNMNIDFSMKGKLSKYEILLLRACVAIVIIDIIFAIFTSVLFSQMDKKQKDVEKQIASENAEISKINSNINSLNAKNTKYNALTAELKVINDKISNIAEMKNTIPNLLNQIMYIIPETVQLTTIQNTTGKKVTIVAQADDYDQLGYFIAKIKVDGILKDAISSSGQKNGNIVSVTIEGELPWEKF